MPVIDPVLSFPPQSRHLGYSLPAITNFHMIGIQSRLHLFADQAAVHRVGIVAHAGVGADEFDRLHEHAGGATAGVIDPS